MRRIQLTTVEQEEFFKTTHDRRLRDRCQAVLMASRGRKRQPSPKIWGGIARRCGSGSSTITNEVWRACRSSGHQANRVGFPRRWHRPSKSG
jgi:hypothetical protein